MPNAESMSGAAGRKSRIGGRASVPNAESMSGAAGRKSRIGGHAPLCRMRKACPALPAEKAGSVGARLCAGWTKCPDALRRAEISKKADCI